MADPLTDLYHDDKTLTKVRDLMVESGLHISMAEDVIKYLLNNSILFREFDPANTPPPAAGELTVSTRLAQIRAILMDGAGGMEGDAADEVITRLRAADLLFLGYRDDVEYVDHVTGGNLLFLVERGHVDSLELKINMKEAKPRNG